MHAAKQVAGSSAAEHGYGVPAFNVNNLEQMRAIMEAADQTDSPVIVQASAGARKYAGAPFLRHLILAATEEFPHIPGIDFSGTVLESENSKFKEGDEVILTGFRVGEVFFGGYSQIAKVNADFLVKKPDNLTSKQAMILGTAGFTSLMSAFAIQARESILLGDKVNDVLVTGATGGVGSVAVIALTKLGYNVTAVTGKDSKADYLKSLGAKTVVNRSEFDKDPRLIDKGLWDGVVDTVGGKILANAIVQTKPNGIIAVCGNANNNELNTSVIPFMLRGIKLWGMDSANCSIKRREFIWSEASKLIDFSLLEKSILTVSLEELIETYPKILKGEISGRVIVDLNK